MSKPHHCLEVKLSTASICQPGSGAHGASERVAIKLPTKPETKLAPEYSIASLELGIGTEPTDISNRLTG